MTSTRKKKEVVGIYLSHLGQALILIYTIYSFITGDYPWAFAGTISFVLTLTPAMIKRKFEVVLPWELTLLMVTALYIYVAGNIRGWYEIFYPIYDKAAHFLTAVLVAILGFVSVVILDKFTEIKMNRIMIVLFTIIFTVAIGAFWEIDEFLCDQLFGTALQKGLEDTMWDLIFDFIGGCVIALLGNFYLKRNSKEQLLNWVGIRSQSTSGPKDKKR